MNSLKRKVFLATLMVICLCALTADKAEAHPASGIVVDTKGQVYFSDLETVWKIDRQGKLSVFRAGVRGRHVHELTIDQQDNIYGADISYESATQKWISDVWKMTPEGTFTYLLAPTADPPRGMSIWRDREGNMYFVDQNNHLKQQTLLLRRTPDGNVITFAGGAYGHADGKGTQAKFSSVGGMAFGPDGSLYVADGPYVRKVSMDGTVTTIASSLNFKTAEDKPTLFGGLYSDLAGLTVDASGNVYVADGGRRRLIKINGDGKVEVVLRVEPPYFPNGVVATPAGDLYVLEVGFTPPNISSGPRVRKISRDGKSTVVAVVGSENGTQNFKAALVQRVEVSLESILEFFLGEGGSKRVAILSAVILALFGLVWQHRRRRKARI
jgi:sugar lactone lactonase YvrE